jgi:DNA-binding CsgD family transcriptional regulator
MKSPMQTPVRLSLQEVAPLPTANSDSVVALMAQEMVEEFVDGILILSERCEVIYANHAALHITHLLSQGAALTQKLPQPLWRLFSALVESRSLFPDHVLVLEDEVATPDVSVRLRSRWLDLPGLNAPSVVVTLEDRQQSVTNLAMTEARQYNLTPRETQVWLLKRANRTYKAIAAELHIAHETVRKHLKNIYAKRQAMMWAND